MQGGFFYHILISAPPLLIAVILHEIAHGLAAKKLGDPTASDAGRLTLNPIKHIDPFWTILLPAMLILAGSPVIFGGAKPVPVDPRYFKRPRKDMMWVALAGPATNIILAVLSLLLYWGVNVAVLALVGNQPVSEITAFCFTVVYQWIQTSVLINTVLALFNLIPIPPLDGGRIAVGLLPWQLARKWMRLERYGILIVFGLLYFRVLDYVFLPIFNFMLALMGITK